MQYIEKEQYIVNEFSKLSIISGKINFRHFPKNKIEIPSRSIFRLVIPAPSQKQNRNSPNEPQSGQREGDRGDWRKKRRGDLRGLAHQTVRQSPRRLRAETLKCRGGRNVAHSHCSVEETSRCY